MQYSKIWIFLQLQNTVLVFLINLVDGINENSEKILLPFPPIHPLTPLSKLEIEQTSILIKANLLDVRESLVFSSISLLEPTKAEMVEYNRKRPGRSEERTNILARKSFSVFFDRTTGKAYEARVNLNTDQVALRMLATGIQPPLCKDDGIVGINVIRKNPEIRKRLRDLGFKSLDNIEFQDWTGGAYEPSERGKRIYIYYVYFREFKGDNLYAHPLNLLFVVDLIAQKVLEIIDLPLNANASTTPINMASLPRKSANYDPVILETQNPDFYRKDSQPLRTRAKDGINFTLKKYKVEWQKFRFRFGFNVREGLVLYDISYRDGARRRPLIYRAALSEMIVPYGDPRFPYQLKSVFDQGEFGLGTFTTSLKPNAECFKDGRLIDVIINSDNGKPKRIRNAICIQEEDGGLLHKHTTSDGRVVSARSKILSINFYITAANYDYGFYWKFHQDASISVEVLLSGLVSTNIYLDKKSPFGTVVSPGVLAQNHQHIFNVRIDPMFDGEANTVSTVDVMLVPDSENPFGQGFTTKETVLRTSREATTDTNLETDRFWKISNPKSINPITKEPVSWKLIPMNQQLLLAKPGSLVWKRARFAAYSVWVTRYRDYELYAAGEYPLTSYGGDGLPKYVKRNESIEGKDIVLWHSFGLSHVPRLEDYPQMAVEKVGFMLRPFNFFSQYPGLDVPPVSTN